MEKAGVGLARNPMMRLIRADWELFLGGGTKNGQQKDIDKAESIWKEYKERKAKQSKKK